MSLINEALKKAQRQRTEGGVENPGYVAGGHTVHHGKGNNANTLVLVGAGALVLIVLSVALTVFLVNRPSAAKHVATTAAAPSAPTTPPASIASAPTVAAPAIVVPIAAAPAPSTSTASSPASTTTAPAPEPGPQTPPVAAQSPAATPPPALAPGAVDERVAAFVDAVRVTGIRSSGTDSKVLMNERVYRVNDIVERNLGIRLIKVAAESLTFSDPRGVIYEKSF